MKPVATKLSFTQMLQQERVILMDRTDAKHEGGVQVHALSAATELEWGRVFKGNVHSLKVEFDFRLVSIWRASSGSWLGLFEAGFLESEQS